MNPRAPNRLPNSARPQVDCDVLIVGAGPAGSSAAAFLAAQGVSCLLVDRAQFPRDKVCGDGLAPQALYWLEKLGCADEVLRHAHCCLTGCEVYINGRYVLAGEYPKSTFYPGFWTLVPRKELDHVLVKHAVRKGAYFVPNCAVRQIAVGTDHIAAEVERAGVHQWFTARLLIGADGAGSIASRFLGNAPKKAIRAVSMRAYYQGVRRRGWAGLYFSEEFFPGYGWCFTDDRGLANVGVGYICDPVFRHRLNVRDLFDHFVQIELKEALDGAEATGPASGGWAAFGRPATRVGNHIMLVGDAGQFGDALNGGGIHKAIESAALAARVAVGALEAGDCSREALKEYERLIDAHTGVDTRTAELALVLAKNPHFRGLYLEFLEQIAALMRQDPQFAEFCSGIFAGTVPQSQCLSPFRLLTALPRRPQAWINLVSGHHFLNGVSAAAGIGRGLLAGTRSLLTHPADHAAWALELGVKALDLGGRMAHSPASSPFPIAPQIAPAMGQGSRGFKTTMPEMEGVHYGYQPARSV